MEQAISISWEPGKIGAVAETVASGSDDDIIGLKGYVIRERSFFGDIMLSMGGMDFPFPRTPVLDFIISWKFSLDEVALTGVSDVGIIDKYHVTRLALRDYEVVAMSTETQATVSVPFVEILAAILRFTRSVLDEITREYPDLLMNDFMENLFRGSLMRELGEEQFLRHSAAMKKRFGRRAD
ncbi:hypothetical protein [Streptomyces sp. DT171]|uniref:hypothetical protein n=1 Tax=Streptomyces sp. DT171 TaxID=3416524 RepID=UPI003CEB3C17